MMGASSCSRDNRNQLRRLICHYCLLSDEEWEKLIQEIDQEFEQVMKVDSEKEELITQMLNA